LPHNASDSSIGLDPSRSQHRNTQDRQHSPHGSYLRAPRSTLAISSGSRGKRAHLSSAGVNIVMRPKQIFEQRVDSNQSFPSLQGVAFRHGVARSITRDCRRDLVDHLWSFLS
jgi:hypothetical protein